MYSFAKAYAAAGPHCPGSPRLGHKTRTAAGNVIDQRDKKLLDKRGRLYAILGLYDRREV